MKVYAIGRIGDSHFSLTAIELIDVCHRYTSRFDPADKSGTLGRLA